MNKIEQALFAAEYDKFVHKRPGAVDELEEQLLELFRRFHLRIDVPQVQRRVRALRELPPEPAPTEYYLTAYGVRGVMRYELPRGRTVYKLPVFSFALSEWKDHWTCLYLIIDGDTLTLVDTGTHLSEASTREALEVVRAVYGVPVALEDIEHVVISHAHFDHFGGLQHVLPTSGARLWVHRWDAGTIANYPTEVGRARERIHRFLQQSGMPADQIAHFMQIHGESKKVFPGYAVDEAFEDGARIVNDYEVIHTPGHCPGLSCLRVGDVMLLGDHVLNDVSPHQFPKIYTSGSGLLNYLNSLVKIAARSETLRLGLPSHYGDIADVESRAMQIMGEHHQRITDLIKDLHAPKTVFQMTHDYFRYRRGRELGGYERLLALEEIGAHVEYMIETLGILRVANPDAVGADPVVPVLYERVA